MNSAASKAMSEGQTVIFQGIGLYVLASKHVEESGNTVYTVRRKNGNKRYALFADCNGTLFNLVPLPGRA